MNAKPNNLLSIAKCIESDTFMMSILNTVRYLALPDWWVGAGFVRDKIWNVLHNFSNKTVYNDIDVIYFDNTDTKESTEKKYEYFLTGKYPSVIWSVKNQARMHVRNNDKPYTSSVEALSNWIETATCVAVSLSADNKLSLIAPHGVSDLLDLIVRPTASGLKNLAVYKERIEKKRWKEKWPNLQIIDK